MSQDLVITDTLTIPAAELQERFSRSSGPGGQGVNTTDSRVELRFDVQNSPTLSTIQRERALDRLAHRLANGVLTVTAQENRSQLANRNAARNRLAALLQSAIAAPPPRRRPTKVSQVFRERRLAAKRRRSQIKRDRQTVKPDNE